MNISSIFLILFLLQFIFLIINVSSQTLSGSTQQQADTIPSQDSISNFQPSLAVVIGMLFIMFSVTFIILLYAKFCHRPSSSVHNMSHQIQDGLTRSRLCSASGLDKTLIESLPFFRFSLLRGSREGLECSVCLAKFEDVEVLRLLPKCKHAFHIDCIDQWLEKHSTCPLCRQKVGPDDLSHLQSSSSLRFLSGSSFRAEDQSNLEIYVEREEIVRSSSRFGSFRKREEEMPIQESTDNICDDEPNNPFHKFNHKINLVSDFHVYFKNRWSNVSSSDIMFLNSEMLNDASSARFSCPGSKNEQKSVENKGENFEMMSIKQEMDRKRAFENKLKEIKKSDDDDNSIPVPVVIPTTTSDSKQGINLLDSNDKRSMSEIIVHPRFTEMRINYYKDSSSAESSNNVKEERLRKLWLPIARKTVQWFVNRERRPSKSRGLNLQTVDHV